MRASGRRRRPRRGLPKVYGAGSGGATPLSTHRRRWSNATDMYACTGNVLSVEQGAGPGEHARALAGNASDGFLRGGGAERDFDDAESGFPECTGQVEGARIHG